MLLSIGYQHFVESKFIVEILKPGGTRAMRIKRQAAASRLLIDATEGRTYKSMIKLNSGHIVLCAILPEILESRRAKRGEPSLADAYIAARTGLNQTLNLSKPPDQVDRRKEPDRRRFSYTAHIPERRMGVERRSGNRNKKQQICSPPI